MKYSLAVILVTTLLVGLSMAPLYPGHAHQGARLFPIVELSDADLASIDLHDGSVDDWLAVLGEAPMTALDFHAFGGYDPADLDFRVWLAWHDATDRLYVAVERADDIYANAFNRGASGAFMSLHDSMVDIWVDSDGGRDESRESSGRISDWESFLLRYSRDSQWYAALAETFDGGPNVQMVNYNGALPAGENWYELSPFAEAGGGRLGESPTLSVTEVYITPFDLFVWDNPDESLISDLHPGKVINIRINISDYEGILDQSGSYPQDSFFRLEESGWSDGILLGQGGELPDISAVEENTWGRIKASFH
ncbi:MAG: hypothetical protein GKR89_11120 [Candidatus Latescibacteria bacterium]|nr:hypothetical protein [Candidatus Latescibacterota bacterium]